MAIADDIRRINRKLESLPLHYSLARRRGIARRAFKPFLTAAANKVRVKTGDLALSIKTMTFRDNKSDVFAGVEVKAKKYKIRGTSQSISVKDTFYAKFIEFGFRQIAWAEKGERIRDGNIHPNRIQEIAPKPFIRPAWQESKGQVEAAAVKEVEKAFKRYERELQSGKYG